MSTSKVLKFEEYRGRRFQRLRVAESLYGLDVSRRALLRHLAEVAELTGADRAAVVWVDEYGPGLVHGHVVLDLLSDRPRRAFSTEPLRRAWELGVPAAFDAPAQFGASIPSTVAVALGSDGTRAWFLVADSISTRPRIGTDVREQLFFLAGECSSVVLHRDLDALASVPAEPNQAVRPRFAGWPILKDIETREDDEPVSRRIAKRFIVGRLIRMLVDDDLALPDDRRREQALRAREELASSEATSLSEAGQWARTLDAFESGEFDNLAAAVLALAEDVEAQGHRHGAVELYDCAYQLAAQVGLPEVAVDAARFCGRVHRRSAEWAESRRWYGVAKEVAESGEMLDRLATVLGGLAVIHRERGNLPAARDELVVALAVAERSGDRDVVGTMHHDLMVVEQFAGNHAVALQHGWRAVRTFDSQERQVRCLSGLGGLLIELGDYSAAEDAWSLVATCSRETYYLVYAFDALAFVAAHRGDAEAFDRRSNRCDELGWETGPIAAKAEILHYRGLALKALGRREAAEIWLRRAIEFAEAHGFARTLFEAEAALKQLREGESTPAMADRRIAPDEVRTGLQTLCEEREVALV